jgi:hypothetical protein
VAVERTIAKQALQRLSDGKIKGRSYARAGFVNNRFEQQRSNVGAGLLANANNSFICQTGVADSRIREQARSHISDCI